MASAQRTLHFKSTDDWLAYNEKFGAGSFMEGFIGSLDRAASNTAMMKVWGPNPRAAFAATIDGLKGKAREAGDVVDMRKLRSKLREAEFDQIDGTALSPESPRLAAISRNLRIQQALSKLGGMTLSSISDTSLSAQTLRRYGVNLLDSYNATLAGLTRLDGAARKEAADIAGVGARQVMNDIASRFAATDGAYGTMAKWQAAFYKLNLFSAWSSGIRRGVGGVLSAHLGNRAGRPFKRLDTETRIGLERYDIDQGVWDTLRHGAQKIAGDPDGRFYLTPEAVDYVDTAKIQAWASKQGLNEADARRELRLRLQAYFTDIADTAMTEPRARENALLRFGTKPGTALGTAIELMMQFKSFPTTILTRHLGPAFRGDTPVNASAAVAHIVIAGTVLGYIARQTKQIAKGMTPESLTDEEGNVRMKVLTAAMVQGGGLGIYGDFLLADYNRFGRSPLGTLLGPSVGEFEGALRIFGALKDGDDASARALRQTMGNIPFYNLFYTRTAMDYLIGFQMQEWVNPGSLRRMEKRAEKDRGQRYLLPPSRVIEKGGGKPFEHLSEIKEELTE